MTHITTALDAAHTGTWMNFREELWVILGPEKLPEFMKPDPTSQMGWKKLISDLFSWNRRSGGIFTTEELIRLCAHADSDGTAAGYIYLSKALVERLKAISNEPTQT